MRFSEIDLSSVYQHLRLEPEAVDRAEEMLAQSLLTAALDFVRSYTGLNDEELDQHEDISVAVLILVSDMYDNRQMTVTGTRTANRAVETILGLHCINLL